MSSSSASVATANAGSSFSSRVDEIRPSKSDINAVIMDYLLSEGYPKAAQKFAIEAKIDPQINMQTVQDRVAIRDLIMAGDIENAIENINDLNPQVLDRKPKLHFALLRLQLIETLRRGDLNNKDDCVKAITFANKQLAPRAKGKPEFVQDLERAMALLVFPWNNLPAELKPLLDSDLRSEIATQINEAILEEHDLPPEAKIKHLIKLRQWSEQKCRDMKKQIPPRLPLGLTAEEELDGQDTDNLNGNTDGDAMIT